MHPDKSPRKNKGRPKERFETIKERVIDRHDINIEVSKDIHPHEYRPPLSSEYRFPPNSPPHHTKMLLEEAVFTIAGTRLEVGEVEPGPNGVKTLRVTVIYPVASEYLLPTEVSDLDREAVWDTFFRQMSLYHGAMRAGASISDNHTPIKPREDRVNINKSSRQLGYRGQELTLSLLQQLHKLYDLFEVDKHTTANRGLGYYSRVSKRPYELDGGDWTPYFNHKSFKHVLVGRLFNALYNFLAQLDRLQRGLKKGEAWLDKPIDAQWVSKMMLDACRAWDDLCWLEDCFSPTDAPTGKSYCLRPTINHPEAPQSETGVPGNWIRRLSESAPACGYLPLSVRTPHTDECEPTATESVLQYSYIVIPELEDPLLKIELQVGVNQEDPNIASTTDLSFKGGPEASVQDAANEDHELEAGGPSVKGTNKGPTPKPVSTSGIKDEQSAKRQKAVITRRPPLHSVPELSEAPSESMSRNNNSHAQSCNLSKKTQPKQNMKSINEGPETQRLLGSGTKRIIAADKAKMDAFEASFKWAGSRPANLKPDNPKFNLGSPAYAYFSSSTPSTACSSEAASSSALSSLAGKPNPETPQAVSTYGPFESAGYVKLPSPCGSFENEGYITRLCHNEDNTAHVDEKRNKIKTFSKIFKK